MKTLTLAEYRHIHNSLYRGTKKLLAMHLGLTPPELTQLLKPKRVYRFATKSFEDKYAMPESKYNAIMEFLGTLPPQYS